MRAGKLPFVEREHRHSVKRGIMGRDTKYTNEKEKAAADPHLANRITRPSNNRQKIENSQIR